MSQLSAEAFKAAIANDPAWASRLVEPVEITDYCEMIQSGITHLSPLLYFTGANEFGAVAGFNQCEHLKVAEGHFGGWVGFSGSSIEKIGELVVTACNDDTAASFRNCKSLKVATGTYNGYVTFEGSAIERIENLRITTNQNQHNAASFKNCANLKVAEGTFPGFVSFLNSGIERIGDLKIHNWNNQLFKADFRRCHKLRIPKEFLGPKYQMEELSRRRHIIRIANTETPDMEI